VSVALVTQDAKRMRLTTMSSVACPALQCFSTLSHKRQDFRINIIEQKCVFYSSHTAWCTVLHEKLTCLQLVKKFPPFHGTRRLITALTSVRHLSLSWASPIQSIYPHPTSWRSILILIIIIIIITFINCNWVVTRWQWLFYMYTKHEIG